MNFSSACLALTFAVFACEKKQAPVSKEASAPSRDTSPTPSETVQPLVGDAACRSAASEAGPNVRWVSGAGLNADLNYDGASDLVLWGTEGDSLFVVSIVECAQQTAGRVWSIPLRARPAFGTLDLEVSVVNPAFGRGFLQENCMGAETTADCRHLAALNARLEAAYQNGGRGLMIGVPDRHNIHMYWDSDSSRFVMWSL